MLNKYYKYILLVIIIFGFILRLQISDELLLNNPNVLYPASVTDMATYFNLASSCVDGKYCGVFKYQPFYYTVFLPLIFIVFGKSIMAVIIAQSLIGALTILFSALSAKILFGKKAAVFTALLLVFSQVLCFYTPFLLIVTLQTFWVSLLLFLVLISIDKGSLLYWSLTGLVLGCSILTRGNMWFFVPGIIVFILISGCRKKAKHKLRSSITNLFLFLFLMLLPMLYFSYWNTKITGKFTGPSTDAGAVLSFGNTPESPPAGLTLHNETQTFWLKTANKIPIKTRIIDFIKEKPLVYSELTFRKALIFWDHREIANNVNVNSEYLLSPTLRDYALITTGLLILLGIPGFILSIPRLNKLRFFVLAYFLIVYWLSITVFYILTRFRAPIIPVLAVYSGGFISYALYFKSNKSAFLRQVAGKACIIAILLLISAFITFLSYDIYRYNFEKHVLKLINPEGIATETNHGLVKIDNGPYFFGGWHGDILTKGKTISKRFIVPEKLQNSYVIFSMPLLTVKPATLLLQINENYFYISFDKAEKKNLKFKVPVDNIKYLDSKDVEIEIDLKVEDISGTVYYHVDNQRDYGRTFINSKPINSELVCRLILPVTLKK